MQSRGLCCCITSQKQPNQPLKYRLGVRWWPWIAPRAPCYASQRETGQLNGGDSHAKAKTNGSFFTPLPCGESASRASHGTNQNQFSVVYVAYTLREAIRSRCVHQNNKHQDTEHLRIAVGCEGGSLFVLQTPSSYVGERNSDIMDTSQSEEVAVRSLRGHSKCINHVSWSPHKPHVLASARYDLTSGRALGEVGANCLLCLYCTMPTCRTAPMARVSFGTQVQLHRSQIFEHMVPSASWRCRFLS